MLAAMSRRFEVFDLLVNTYGADESLRDYSGKTAAGFMEQRHLPLPGVPQRVDIRQMEYEVMERVAPLQHLCIASPDGGH